MLECIVKVENEGVALDPDQLATVKSEAADFAGGGVRDLQFCDGRSSTT